MYVSYDNTPQQNGLSERKNRSLTETGKCLLFEAKMNLKYWGEAIMTANYLLNRLPTRCHDKTPFEMLYGDKPKLGHIKTFGCTSYMLIPKQNRKKLDEKSLKLKLVGYCETSKAYRLLDIETDRIYISRDVRFIENNNEPNYESQKNQPGENEQSIEISLSNENQIENINENVDEDVNENDNEDDEYIDNPNEYGVQNNDVDGNQLNEVSVINNSNLDNSNVSLNEDFENIIDKFNYDQEPANYEEAMKSRDRRNWQKAMSEELNDMLKHEAWEIVPIPENKSVVHWLSRKQQTVSLSSSEAEYISLSESCKEFLWLRSIYHDMTGVSLNAKVKEDNQSVISMVKDCNSINRTKHIDVRYHFVRDLADSKTISLEYCESKQMLADVMTKALPINAFKIHRDNLNLS